jgi:serine/threonine protein kinase
MRYSRLHIRHYLSGVAHRDLKPENFMLSSNKASAVAKLADFGLSKILVNPGGGSEQTVCGTPSYVAPEILDCLNDGGVYNAVVADAWSLGCNLYILLSGYPPFWRYDDNQKALFDHISINDWSFDQPCWESISDDAKNLVRELMEPDLTKRLSVKDAVNHKWCSDKAPETELTLTMEKLKLHVVNNRFKKTSLAIMAKHRMSMGTGDRDPNKA